MKTDELNLNHLRIFESVYRLGSMSQAAIELHLTQSGVSQHMGSLEESLGVKLFDRVKQKLIPTSSAHLLFESWSHSYKQIEEVLWSIRGVERELRGSVTFGVPVEFGNNMVLPLLSQFSTKHPEVKFKIRLEFASTLNDMLLDGEIDFAFIDEFKMDKSIRVQKVFDEILDLCATEAYLDGKGTPKNSDKFYQTLDYVEYEEGEPILKMWFSHHLGVRDLRINVRAHVMDAQSNARLILAGIGAGILPGHLVTKLQKEGHPLLTLKGSGKPLKNTISVAQVEGRTHSPAASALLSFLVDSLDKTTRK